MAGGVIGCVKIVAYYNCTQSPLFNVMLIKYQLKFNNPMHKYYNTYIV